MRQLMNNKEPKIINLKRTTNLKKEISLLESLEHSMMIVVCVIVGLMMYAIIHVINNCIYIFI